MLGNSNLRWPKPRGSRGNFDHLRWLFDEVDQPLLIQVDAPGERMNALREKLARCPAAHNRALFGEERN